MATQQEQEARRTGAPAATELRSAGCSDIEDPEFYEGLKSISQAMTKSGASDEEVQATLQNARKYYLWRKKQEQATPGAPNEKSHDPQAEESDPNESEYRPENASEPYPNSFSAIVELIATGNADKVPGVRDIPLKINEEKPSVSTRVRPEKPWEKATSTTS